MNSGISLNALAAELTRQVETRKDYIAPQAQLTAVVDEQNAVVLDGFNSSALAITPYAHGQLADHLGIPKRYYDRMAEERPELLATNINAWFKQDADNRRMVRTLDGKVRAILSPKFRPLDNFDLAQATLPVLIEKGAQIVSAQLTETRMYIKATLPSLSDELPEGLSYGGHNRIGTDRGHLVSAIVISNSDIGAGTLRVEPSVFTTWCTNLAIMQQAAMKKYHTGRANEADATFEVLTDEARKADDRAFWLKVRDITNAAFDEKAFRTAIASMRRAGEKPLRTDDLPKVVEVAIEQLALPVGTNNGILKHLAGGGDFTAWGLSSAITRVAGELEDYETSTQLERAGGLVLALPAAQWEAIATAA